MREKNHTLKGNNRRSVEKLREFVDPKWSVGYHSNIFNVFYLLGQLRNISVVNNITLVCLEKDLLCKKCVGQHYLKLQPLGIVAVHAENNSERRTGLTFHHFMKICAEPVLAHLTDN